MRQAAANRDKYTGVGSTPSPAGVAKSAPSETSGKRNPPVVVGEVEHDDGFSYTQEKSSKKGAKAELLPDVSLRPFFNHF